MEEPITPVVPDESGASAQPPEPANEPAAVTPQPAPDSNPQEPSLDDNSKWLQSKGIDPATLATPEGQAALVKNAIEAEKLMSKATQQASQLEKSLNTNSADEVSGLRTQVALMQFKVDHPDYKTHEPVMAELLQETVNTPYGTYPRAELLNAGLISLDDVYTMAKGKSNQENVQDVLQSIANKQRAGSAPTNAVNTTPKVDDDPFMRGIRQSRGQ